jgi:tellurite resistance protein TehA-like permease
MSARQPVLQAFPTSYFGVVMATGIVSIASHLAGHPLLAHLLVPLNVGFYLALCAFNVLRALLHPGAFRADVADHLRGPGFFTWVAASGVLGVQFALLWRDYRLAWLMWGVTVALWIGFTYAIFFALTVKEEKPPLERGISGAWLLAVVATQSVAVLSVLLAMREAAPFKRELNFLALCMWLWGGMLYIWMMSLIFYRYTFFRLSPGDLTPPYWINMGAMAISTLAGSLLIANAADAPLLAQLLPFIVGFTIFYWATGTWWIPMLLALGVWRYVYKRHPLRYDPLYWGAVFPLGMYAAATIEMAAALRLPFLEGVGKAFVYLAIAGWLAAFIGLVRSSFATRHAGGPKPR